MSGMAAEAEQVFFTNAYQCALARRAGKSGQFPHIQNADLKCIGVDSNDNFHLQQFHFFAGAFGPFGAFSSASPVMKLPMPLAGKT